MKKFFNAAIEKAKAVWARLKSLVRKSESEAVEAAEETAEAEPSVVENVATVIGMCALVGVVAFCIGRIVVDLRVILHGVCLWAYGLAHLIGVVPHLNVPCFPELPFGLMLLLTVIAALVAVVAYICSIIKSAHDNDRKVSDCARRDLNRAVNYCKNHPYKVLLFVLVSLTCVPAVWLVPQTLWYDALYAIAANYGRVAAASFALCSHIVEAALFVAALA